MVLMSKPSDSESKEGTYCIGSSIIDHLRGLNVALLLAPAISLSVSLTFLRWYISHLPK